MLDKKKNESLAGGDAAAIKDSTEKSETEKKDD
jgi:hypothetical protein